MTQAWRSFTGGQVEALAQGTSFLAEPGERNCPACGARAVRAYLSTVPDARRPTLLSYVWCTGCHRFVGTRAARPPGLVFPDPLADLPAAQRRAWESSVAGFFARLDELWDAGVLPQSFAVQPA